MTMWDSNSNSIEELEEVTADELDWPIPQSSMPSSRSSVGGGGGRGSSKGRGSSGGRRGRKATISGNAECLVCRLTASGNNFGVATCESCKTFFRRNAKRELSQIRCLHYNNCNVVKEYRRSCTACRLRKCFAVGMRKELILSDEKLRTRARPTFKKPRYRWCRLPASVDVEQLLSVLQAGKLGRPGETQLFRVKEEASEPAEDETFQSSAMDSKDTEEEEQDDSRPNSPVTSEAEFSPAAAGSQFAASQIYERLAACVSEFVQPYDSRCASSIMTKIYQLEDGFTSMDNPIRKMIRLIPEMPHFNQLDKSLLGRLIKLKVFGAIQITSLLSFDLARDAWVYKVESGGGSGSDEAVFQARETVQNTFMSLTKRCLLDGRALYTPADVDRMYQTLTGFYHQMHRVFGEHSRMAAVVLLALYLLQDDVPLLLSDSERLLLRQLQWHYLGYLDDLVYLVEVDREAVSYTSKRILMLLMQIRWLDTCFADAAKTLQVSRLPPLMQELVAD